MDTWFCQPGEQLDSGRAWSAVALSGRVANRGRTRCNESGGSMSGLSDVERDAERAAQALRVAAAYLRATGLDDIDEEITPQALVIGEGLVAAERVLAHLRVLRRPGDGASAAYPERLAPWHDWCPHGAGGLPPRSPLRRPGHGDPGE